MGNSRDAGSSATGDGGQAAISWHGFWFLAGIRCTFTSLKFYNLYVGDLLYLSMCVSLLSRVWLFLQAHGLQPAWLLCPWDFPSKNIGVGCHSLLPGIFPTQGLNLHLLQVSCIDRRILYCQASITCRKWCPLHGISIEFTENMYIKHRWHITCIGILFPAFKLVTSSSDTSSQELI